MSALRTYTASEIVQGLGLAVAEPSEDRARLEPADRDEECVLEGGRNDALTRLAGAMRRQGANRAAIARALLAFNEEQCVPPLDDGEVKKIARSVSKYEPAVVASASAMVTVDEALSKLRVEQLPEGFEQHPPPPRPHVIGSYVPRGKVSLLVSAGTAGKSTVLSEQTCAVATGLAWRGHAVEQGAALILTWEDDASDYHAKFFAAVRANPEYRERVDQIRANVRIVPLHGLGLHLVEMFDRRAAVGPLADAVCRLIEGIPNCVWVIVETASRANAADEMNESFSTLVEAGEVITSRCNVGLTISHHSNKASIRSGNVDAAAVRGGSALADNSRATTVLAALGEDADSDLLPAGWKKADLRGRELLLIDNVRSSYARRAPRKWLERVYLPGSGIPYFIEPAAPESEAEALCDGRAEADAKFEAFLRERVGSEWRSERVITRDWVEDHGLAERKARAALGRLEAAGKVERKDRPQYGDRGRMTTMYRVK